MTAITPFKFKNKEVRTIIDEHGEALFVGKDVCDNLAYADHTNAMKQHCRGVAKHHPIPDGIGRLQSTRVLTEADVLRLVVNSALPAAEEFERWVFEDVLPSIRKTGSYTAPQAQAFVGNRVAYDLEAVEVLARFLNVSPSGKITMARVVLEQSAPHLLPTLPAYAVDAPADATTDSSEPTASLTALLKANGVNGTAAQWNKRLHNAGLLRQATRETSNGGTKKFWVVFGHGLKFGKNVTSPENPRETTPHWYESTFQLLLDEAALGDA